MSSSARKCAGRRTGTRQQRHCWGASGRLGRCTCSGRSLGCRRRDESRQARTVRRWDGTRPARRDGWVGSSEGMARLQARPASRPVIVGGGQGIAQAQLRAQESMVDFTLRAGTECTACANRTEWMPCCIVFGCGRYAPCVGGYPASASFPLVSSSSRYDRYNPTPPFLTQCPSTSRSPSPVQTPSVPSPLTSAGPHGRSCPRFSRSFTSTSILDCRTVHN